MKAKADTRFLALLVHRGLLPRDVVQDALASGKPEEWLLRQGHVEPEQWARWLRTDGGVKPELSRYRLDDLLGEGGTARVWRARDHKTGDTVALKVLRPEIARDRAALRAFVQESKLLIELECAHIVKGMRVAREGDTFFCAMELLDGDCLQDRVGEGRPLPEDTALAVIQQVGRALAYLHGKGLVHRDVKPGNVVLCRDGRAVLIDLGFAVVQAGDDGSESDLTAGTVHYIAPEQARGHRGLDVRADIYALGATLYHLVTGSLPFEGETHEEVMAKQVREALSGDAFRRLGLSPQVHYFIEKMMAKEKEYRFQSPDQLVEEITRHLEAKERERTSQPPERPRRRRRFL